MRLRFFIFGLMLALVICLFTINANAANCGTGGCEPGETMESCPVDCECEIPVDVMLMIDTSGSMIGSKMSNAKAAARFFVGLMNKDYDKVGVVSFWGNYAVLKQNLTFNYQNVNNSINSLVADDDTWTPMGYGISTSYAEFLNTGRSGVERVVILLTDGFPTVYEDSNGVARRCAAEQPSASTACTDYALLKANQVKAQGTIIYTIGFGTNMNDFTKNLMKSLASSSDKFYYTPTSSQSDLENVYKSIAARMCPVYKLCQNVNDVIMSLSRESDAHGENYSGTGDYKWQICYNEIFGVAGNGDRTCHGNKVLGLNAGTNAHAQKPSSTDYLTNVCYGDLTCTSANDACPAGYSLVTSLSDNTNAHLSDTNDYPVKICCKPAVQQQISLTYANWTNANEIEINHAYIGDEVKMIAKGVPDSTLVNFSIYTTSNNIILSKTSNITGGKANASWIPSVQGDYYFNASVASNPAISIKSGNLKVESVECFCLEDGSSCNGCSSISGKYCNATGGLVDDASCIQGCITDDDCPEETPTCIDGDCFLTEIKSCSKYENRTACGHYEPKVANYTIQVENNQGDGYCGSVFSYSSCTAKILCECYWDGSDETDGVCRGNARQVDDSCGHNSNVGEGCSWLNELLQDCDATGKKLVRITTIWTGGDIAHDWCVPGSEDVKKRCAEMLELPFSSTASLIIAIIIIIVFYLIVVRKRKVIKKPRRKRD